MTTSTAIFKLCEIIILLIFAMGFTRIVPMIKNYVDQTVDEKKQEKIRKWATDAVHWAEDLLKDEDGRAKLAVEKEFMKLACAEIGLNLTEKQIDILLRSAYQMMLKENIEYEDGYFISADSEEEEEDEDEEAS